ncbi:hypothetical protein ACQUFY_10775 [Robbsia andropogonis]|uniref:hypothetical protein n=1 Tax=Robbsia andropogonis TaxID=28092 RepID=UPI003D1FCD92
MTTKSDLLAIAVTALTGTTDAGSKVWTRRDQSTSDDDYPCLFVTMPLSEQGESFGRNGAPAFTVTASLMVEARVAAPGGDDDLGAEIVYQKLCALRDQIKRAVINYGPLMSQLQQFPFFKVEEKDAPGDSRLHIGAILVEIGMEFVQSAEDFYQPQTAPLQGFDVTVQQPEGTVEPIFSIDLPQTIS